MGGMIAPLNVLLYDGVEALRRLALRKFPLKVVGEIFFSRPAAKKQL